MTRVTSTWRRAGAGAASLLLVLTACSGGDDSDDDGLDGARTTAGTLAEGLGGGDLREVEFTDVSAQGATRDYRQVVAGMGDLRPEVAVVSVEPAGAGEGRAEATLAWTWPFGAEGWTYESTVRLTRPGIGSGPWLASWARDVVLPGLAEESVLEASTEVAERGEVLGAGGEVLVTERPVVRVGIDKTGIGDGIATRSATELAGLTGVDPGPFRRAVAAAGDRAFVEAITYRADEVPPAVEAAGTDVDGVLLLPDERALAPTRTFAAPILGTVGEVTAEMVADDPDAYQAGDVAGLSGLEARYDEQLRGTDGALVEAVGPGSRRRTLTSTEAVPGEDLTLTLDRRRQTLAEEVLAPVGPASALVAVRPSTGEIVAAANGPGNDGQNLATFGQYAPGSTFKTVTSLALLRAGLTPESPVTCPPTVDVDGRTFGNYSDYPAGATGTIALRTAVADSCNTAFITSRDRIGDDDLAAAAASLGLGVDHDLGFPAYLGEVPPATTETGRAADTIGQGTVLASPMAMATVIASVQQGSTVVPSLVAGMTADPAGDTEPVSWAEADQLRTMLRGVVTDGSGTVLADLPGAPVIAKTGTAEYAAPDGSTRTHAWMVAARGDLAVAVFVADGASGSSTAGPLLADFLRRAG